MSLLSLITSKTSTLQKVEKLTNFGIRTHKNTNEKYFFISGQVNGKTIPLFNSLKREISINILTDTQINQLAESVASALVNGTKINYNAECKAMLQAQQVELDKVANKISSKK